MKITHIHELSVAIEGNIANSLVSFAEHDVSLVGLVSDVIRNGRPVVGYAFNSIGRFAQGGILRDRMIPRLRAAPAGSLLDVLTGDIGFGGLGNFDITQSQEFKNHAK